MVTARRATLADFDDIVRMLRVHHRVSKSERFAPFDETRARATLVGLATGGLLLVAEQAGRIVGSLGAFVGQDHWCSPVKMAVELWWWVDPESRGSGAGREMAKTLNAWAKDSGAAFLTMTATDATDGAAVGEMYRRQGFERVETAWTRRL